MEITDFLYYFKHLITQMMATMPVTITSYSNRTHSKTCFTCTRISTNYELRIKNDRNGQQYGRKTSTGEERQAKKHNIEDKPVSLLRISRTSLTTVPVFNNSDTTYQCTHRQTHAINQTNVFQTAIFH